MSVGGAGFGQNFRAGESQQIVQLFGREAEATIIERDGVEEPLPGRGRQVVEQRSAAVRVDVDAVAL